MSFLSRLGKSIMKCKPVAKTVAKVAKNKPELLAATGGVLIIVAFGWGIYEAMNLKDTMEESSEKVKKLEADYESKPEEEKATLAVQYKKELREARIDGVWKITKKLAPPTILLATALGMGYKGFEAIRVDRLMWATLAKESQDFMRYYRNNVINDLGKEADEKYSRGSIGSTEVELAPGGKTEMLPVSDPNKPKWPYRFYFNKDTFTSYVEDADSNINFLKNVEEWFNYRNKESGSVTMYDILTYTHYDFAKARASMTQSHYKAFIKFLRTNGWWYDPNNEKKISLGLYKEANAAAMNRYTPVVVIEMNCDANITEG